MRSIGEGFELECIMGLYTNAFLRTSSTNNLKSNGCLGVDFPSLPYLREVLPSSSYRDRSDPFSDGASLFRMSTSFFGRYRAR